MQAKPSADADDVASSAARARQLDCWGDNLFDPVAGGAGSGLLGSPQPPQDGIPSRPSLCPSMADGLSQQHLVCTELYSWCSVLELDVLQA